MIELRKIQLKDVESLAEIAVKAYYDHYVHLWFDGGKWYVDKCFNIKQLSGELSDTSNEFYLAKEGNTIFGFLKLKPNHDLSDESKNGFEIERIYLIKEATGRGFGTEMMNFSIEKAKELDKNYVWLKAMDSSESAIRFYKKLGFEIYGTSRLDFETMKPEFRGMVTMIKKLKTLS